MGIILIENFLPFSMENKDLLFLLKWKNLIESIIKNVFLLIKGRL